MRKRITGFILVLALVLSGVGGVFAAPDREEKVTVIVAVSGDAVLEAANAKKVSFRAFCETNEAARLERGIRTAQNKVQSEIQQTVDQGAEIGFVYTHVFNGFSIKVSPDDIESIKALPGVENVYLSCKKPLYGEPAESGVYINSGSEMMHTSYMHELGYKGQGMVIAVLDGGFDLNHENFQGAITGARLSKADIAAKIESGTLSSIAQSASITANRVYRSEKIPYAFNYYLKDSDTYDSTNSHGLHVAGIAAGNNGTDPLGNKFVGTAPDAQLLLMGCGVNNYIYTDEELAAMDDAVKLGADVINASFGADYGEYNPAEEVAVNNVVKAGVLFAAAAGNMSRGYEASTPSADLIDYASNGTPSCFTSATAVANVDNAMVWQIYREMNVGGEVVKFYDANNSYSFAQRFRDKEYDFEYAGIGSTEDFKGVDVSGKIAVMNRGAGMTFSQKISNATAAGAIGAVFINTGEDYEVNILQASLRDMPTATVSFNDEVKFKEAVKKTIQTDTEIKNGMVSHAGNIIDETSSWGTNSSLELKPEITAPGGSIYSSVNDDQYENMTGTSMATPHMAGASALMMQYIREHPGEYPDVQNIGRLVENLMMTSADVLMQKEDIPYSPRLQGAGLVNLEKATKTPVILLGDISSQDGLAIEKSKISLKEIEDSFTLHITARNLSGSDVTYDSVRMTVITDGADTDDNISGMRKLSFQAVFPESVTVPAGGEVEVSIPVALDGTELDENMATFINGFFVDGFVFFANTADAEIPEISIPFTGFYGGWNSQPVFDKPFFCGESLLGETYLCTDSKRMENGDFDSTKEEKIMGTNWFVDKDDPNHAAYCDEKYVGYSPNGDGEADIPQVKITPMRQPGETEVIIYNAAGDEVSKSIDNQFFNVRKYIPSYLEFSANQFQALSDGDYSMEIRTGLKGAHPYEKTDSIKFQFYLDREAPVITKFEKSNDGCWLTVAATDNRQIMGFVLHGEKVGVPFTDVYPIEAVPEAEAQFYIEDADEGSLEVEAVDYAQNKTVRSEKGLEFAYLGFYATSLLFKVNNTIGSDIKPTVILALYKDDALVGIYTKDDVIPDGDSVYTFNIKNVGYSKMRLFVWDSLTGMVPWFDTSEFLLQ